MNNLGNLKMENNEYKLRSLKETNAYIQEKFSEAKQFIGFAYLLEEWASQNK